MINIIAHREDEGTTPTQWVFLFIVVVIILGIGYGVGMYDFEQDDSILN